MEMESGVETLMNCSTIWLIVDQQWWWSSSIDGCKLNYLLLCKLLSWPSKHANNDDDDAKQSEYRGQIVTFKSCGHKNYKSASKQGFLWNPLLHVSLSVSLSLSLQFYGTRAAPVDGTSSDTRVYLVLGLSSALFQISKRHQGNY